MTTTPDTLKLAVAADKTRFGKRSGKFTAALCGFSAAGATKDEALAELRCLLEDLSQHAFTRRYLITPKGTVFALYHVPGGWSYDIIHTEKSGAVHPSSCSMGPCFEKAFDSMRRHWEHMCADEQLTPQTV